MAVDLDRLRETLGTPELSRIVRRLRRRFELGGGVDGVVALADPTAEERTAVDRLLGRPPSAGATVTVRLSALDEVLRHGEIAPGLREAMEALTGPIVDERERARDIEESWRRLLADSAERVASRPELAGWLEDVAEGRFLRRIAGGDPGRARRLLDRAFDVLDRLPAAGVPLAELSALATGDSHGLDQRMPLGRLVLRAAARLGGVEPPEDAAGRRDAWAAVGVLLDELSAPVLTLNLRAVDDTFTGAMLCRHAERGEPYRVTTRQLLRSPPRFDVRLSGDTVHVCENPTVVAAAANRLGSSGAPLVCTEGQPKTAARLLFARLAEAGVRLFYHGDFDWGGVRIANLLVRRHGVEPWRFRTGDYLAAAAGGSPLRGSPVTAIWDEELEPAMRRERKAVHEEEVLDLLIADLRR